ncbi:hypothetical protein D3C75_1016280 [compost metagenome]
MLALGLGNRISVAVCSISAAEISLFSASSGLCVAKMPIPFCLRMVFCLFLANSFRPPSPSRIFQNSSIT